MTQPDAELILTAHRRSDIRGCACGWCDPTTTHPAHQVTQLRRAGLLTNPAPTDQPPAPDGPTPTDPTDPTPVHGLTLQTLQSLVQDVTHCGQPMQFINGRCTWEGAYGNGHEHQTTSRACTVCGATLTTSSTVPS